MSRYLRVFFLGVVLLLVFISASTSSSATAAGTRFGYGFNVAEWDINMVQSMGFNWIKVFSNPDSRLPVKVLRRVDAHAGDMVNLTAFGNEMAELAQAQAGYIDAYEIGNEPNLDASYGWAAPPNAADYARLLCVAYNRIKNVDPVATVVSAGLAPTGRVQGNWNGHPGHNGHYQDERQYLLEFVAAGGGNCLDAVGYHPYGFSADYNATPDVASSDSTKNCANGFCFRGVEKIYQLMQANGLGGKKVWATEYGWIVRPPDACMSDAGWQGRQWQIVSEAKQASNLAGSFEYATANWPWMEAMFIFNLNFNTVSWYSTCEQMRYYGVEDRPAEAALRDMPKVEAPTAGRLEVMPGSITLAIADEQTSFEKTVSVELRNTGVESLTYTITAGSGSIVSNVSGGSGTLAPNKTAQVQVTIKRGGRPIGTYNTSLTIDVTPDDVEAPATIPVSLFIFDEVHTTHLAVITRD
ncbi:MAG TPA: hypothetical protein VF177_01500 [Anaerolineae bacterium]